MGHELAITRFHIALKRFCEDRRLELYWRQTNLKRTVHPDALFGITFPDLSPGMNTYPYFLEIERSKQGHYQDRQSGLIRKLKRYYEYQGSAQCREDWRWFDRFRVVVVVKNGERRRNLLLALEETQPSRIFWITTEDADLSQKVCLTPKDYRQTAYSLLE